MRTIESLTLPDVARQPLPVLRALQDRLLRETVELAYRAHPFYRAVMRREGIEPRHIQGCDDLVRLPVTTKQDFLADPDAFRMDPAHLPEEEGTLWKMIYTTGTTTGRPAPISVTTFDHYAFMHDVSRRDTIRPTDIIANLFPLTVYPMGAYSRAADEAAANGAGIVFGHTGRPAPPFPLHHSLDEAVRLVERHRATVLWGVAGFIRRVLVRAGELDADLRSVRMAMITGEASSAAMREDMRARMQRLGCAGDVVLNRYGVTELGSSLVECQPGSGFHDMAPDQIYYELLEKDSWRPVPDGGTGMLTFTHLIRRGTVFLRYVVGDVVSLTRHQCPHCGRTAPRVISQPTRTGDIVKIKGTLVNLQALKDRLEQLEAVDEYQLVVQRRVEADPFSDDEFLVRLAVAPGREEAAAAMVEAEVLRIAKIRGRIEFAPRDAIYDPATAAKPRRVVDRRLP